MLEAELSYAQGFADLGANRPINVRTKIITPAASIEAESFRSAYPCPVFKPLDVICGYKSTAPHVHDYNEIVVVYGGMGTHWDDRVEMPAERSTVIYAPRGTVHANKDIRDWHLSTIYYLPELLLPDLRHVPRENGFVPWFYAPALFHPPAENRALIFHLTEEVLLEVIREIDVIHAELAAPGGSELFVRACLNKLFVRFAQALQRLEYDGLDLTFAPEVWAAIDAVEDCIVRGQVFQVGGFARRAGFTPWQFSRFFKQHTGLTPLEFYQQRRVHHACILLLNPNYTISDVAYLLGYSSASNFTNMFKRQRSMPPSTYRRRYGTAARCR